MPTQIFKITRAPEAIDITARELRSLLWHMRPDTEWAVLEIKEPLEAKEVEVNKICANCCNCESTYPLDPKGTLYCDITEKYVYNSDSCEYFKAKEG